MIKLRKILIFLLIILISLNIYLLIYKISNKAVLINTVKETIITDIELIIYKEYKIGDIVNINDEEWRVIEDSNKEKDYITLINLNYNRKIKDCFNKYVHLNEKNYLEGEYSNSLGKDLLKEVEGYKIRLIKLEEYEKLAILTKKEIDEIKYNYTVKFNYDWVKDINTFTMTNVDYYYDIEDNTDTCISWYIQSNIRQVFGNKEGFISIQPVINVYKEKI